MAIIVTDNGIRFRRARSKDDTPAISDMAMITPAIGDAARPMLEASCIGNIMFTPSNPTLVAMEGTSGPNEKNDAFPLPISMDAAKISNVIRMAIPAPEKPMCCENITSESIKPRLISPLEKTSAATINVITLANTLPIPSQKVLMEANTFLRFLWRINSKMIAMKNDMNIAVVVSSSTEKLNNWMYFENTIRRINGNTGRMA